MPGGVNLHDTTRYRLEVVAILSHYKAIRHSLAFDFLAAVEEAHARAVASPLARKPE